MDISDDNLIRKSCSTMQIISGTLVMGLVTLLGLAVFFNFQGGAGPVADMPLISILAVALLAINVPLAFLVPGMMERNALGQIAAGTFGTNTLVEEGQLLAQGSDTRKLLAVKQTTVIVSRALFESAGFFGGIAYLVEKNWLGLAAALAALVLMLLTFPTEGRLRDWLENRKSALEEMRLGRQNQE
jgi:hypothetical protein